MSGPICVEAVKTVHINMTSLNLNIIACPMTFVDVLDLRLLMAMLESTSVTDYLFVFLWPVDISSVKGRIW